MDSGIPQPAQGGLQSLRIEDNRFGGYLKEIDSEIAQAEQEEINLNEQKAADRAEAQSIQEATAVTQKVLRQMFGNISKEYGDNDKLMVISDYIVHTMKLKNPRDIENALKDLVSMGGKQYHGIDKPFSVIGGHR